MAEFDSYRPPEAPRGPRRNKTGGGAKPQGKKQRRGEELMVPKADFEQYDSYYG